jgi:hypothetical protein
MSGDSVVIKEAGVSDILTSRLLDHTTWSELMRVFDEALIANVDSPIKQLEQLRFLPPNADNTTLSDVCRMLGFDLSQDVMNMSIDKISKIATQLGMYPDTNGTEEFTKFISLMTNGTCTVDYLWTDDYINFSLTPGGATIDRGGNWFKTTHVDLNMGFSTLDGLQLRSGQTLGQRIVEIFYQQAPATLVIRNQTFTVTMTIQSVAVGMILNSVERVYELDCAGGLNI